MGKNFDLEKKLAQEKSVYYFDYEKPTSNFNLNQNPLIERKLHFGYIRLT